MLLLMTSNAAAKSAFDEQPLQQWLAAQVTTSFDKIPRWALSEQNAAVDQSVLHQRVLAGVFENEIALAEQLFNEATSCAARLDACLQWVDLLRHAPQTQSKRLELLRSTWRDCPDAESSDALLWFVSLALQYQAQPYRAARVLQQMLGDFFVDILQPFYANRRML